LAAKHLSGGESQYMVEKIEAILAILVADRMGRVSADATLQGTITKISQVLQIIGGTLFAPPSLDFQYHTLVFQTAVTGFAYGLRGTTSIITSTLISIIILLCYITIAVTHIVYTLCISGVFVSNWQNVMDLVALAFHSKITYVPSMRDTSMGIKTTGPLKTIVAFKPVDDHIEIEIELASKGIIFEQSGERWISSNGTPDSGSEGVRHHSV
jgi:hypothetical protein